MQLAVPRTYSRRTDISCPGTRWEAVYFPVYQNERPLHLVFIGVSGD
jgi:hypothetical protein